jgi:hypothetical protein
LVAIRTETHKDLGLHGAPAKLFKRAKRFMRDELVIFLALVFLALGAVLVFEGAMAWSDLTQSARLVGGATLLVLGAGLMRIVIKDRWRRRKTARRYRSV